MKVNNKREICKNIKNLSRLLFIFKVSHKNKICAKFNFQIAFGL